MRKKEKILPIPRHFASFGQNSSRWLAVQLLESKTAKLVPMLQQLGMRHVGYGLKPEYFDLAGKILIEVLVEWLGEGFTKEVENAWVMVSGFMVATMHGGYLMAAAELKAKEKQVFVSSLKDYSPPASTAGSDFESKTSRQATPEDEIKEDQTSDRGDSQVLSFHPEGCESMASP